MNAEQKSLNQRSTVGFWLYLMTDSLLFASLFAAYVVLRNGTADGPMGRDIFELPMVLTETIILLTSSLTSGIAVLALKSGRLRQGITLLVATFLLGASFLFIELQEFSTLISDGHDWHISAFLSIFFALVATHGAHILIGLVWLSVMLWSLLKKGISPKSQRQLGLFGMYWHFLDLVWIFIFTVVYLGAFI